MPFSSCFATNLFGNESGPRTFREIDRLNNERILEQHFAEAAQEGKFQQQHVRAPCPSANQHRASPESVAGQCGASRLANHNHKMFLAEQGKFLDAHFKLLVAASELVQQIDTCFTQGSQCVFEEQDLETDMNKMRADQNLALLQTVTDLLKTDTESCMTMACQIAALSQKAQKDKRTKDQCERGPEYVDAQQQHVESHQREGRGSCKPDAVEGQSVTGNKSAPPFQSVMPAETHRVSIPIKNKQCYNPLRELCRALGGVFHSSRGRHQTSVSYVSNAIDEMSVQAGTDSAQAVPSRGHPQQEEMSALSHPNWPVLGGMNISEDRMEFRQH